jgi:hypothetical protein
LAVRELDPGERDLDPGRRLSVPASHAQKLEFQVASFILQDNAKGASARILRDLPRGEQLSGEGENGALS